MNFYKMMPHFSWRGAGLFLILIMAMTLFVPPAIADDPVADFLKRLKVQGVRDHQREFQRIANRNNGTRVSGTGGYDASAQYVFNELGEAEYEPTFQEFEFDFFQQLSPPILEQLDPDSVTYTAGVDHAVIQYSGSSDVTAPVTPVDIVLDLPRDPVTSGCEPEDFAGFPAGNIALIQRGTCFFADKAINAQNAGASGVIIFNQGNSPDREGLLGAEISGTLDGAIYTIPVIFVTFAVGEDLATPGGGSVHLQTDTISEIRETRNVIAETPGGDPNHVVVVGAHLDSVAEGPGINDNGSGSAVILEIALLMAQRRIETDKKIRFMWYGAEEQLLVGSTFYVFNLPPEELDKIDLMLNFDMVGSPNFVRFVYDGDGSGGLSDPGPPGSDAIEQVFLDFFASRGLATEPTAFDGRSDYGPFIEVGIPAGGLFTGAEGIKTPEQAAIYGGTAGQQYDPCYHLACDTFENNSNKALDQMSDAAAYAILTLAGVGDNESDDGNPNTGDGDESNEDSPGNHGDEEEHENR